MVLGPPIAAEREGATPQIIFYYLPDTGHRVMKMISLFVIIIVITSGLAIEARGDNALISIDFRLKNIAISKDQSPKTKDTVNEPGGIDYYIGDMITSDEEIKDDKGTAASKYPKIAEKIKEIKKETRWGRTVDIRWRIVNYEPMKDILCTSSNHSISRGYHLFGISWIGRKVDCRFQNEDGKWKSSQYVPTVFRFKSPSPATVKGYGDVPVFIPGLGFDLKRINAWYVEEVVSDQNYKILVNQYLVEKILHFRPSDASLENKKLEVEGRATLGDSGIKTETDSFWFPFDRYSFEFLYTSFFPSRVDLKMEDIEDLNLASAKNYEYSFPAGKNAQVIKIILNRKVQPSDIWTLLTLAFSLTALLGVRVIEGKRKKRFKFYWRFLGYLFIGFIIYWQLPNPLNVPLVNLLSLVVGATFLFCILRNEVTLHPGNFRIALARYSEGMLSSWLRKVKKIRDRDLKGIDKL